MKNLFFLSVFLISLLTLNAQTTFFIDGGGGYALSIASQHYYLDVGATGTNGAPAYSSDSKVHAKRSFGMGALANINMGFLFGKYFGISLRNYYLFGNPIKTNTYLTYYGNNYKFETSASARSYQIVPGLLLHVDLKKVSVRTTFGLLMGTTTINYSQLGGYNPYNLNISGGSTFIKQKDYGGISLGFAGSLGLSVKLKKAVRYYIDVSYNILSYSPNKGEITSYQEDGVEKVTTLSIHQREVEYVTDVKKAATSTNANYPSRDLKQSVPMSSIGIVMGIEICIPTKKKSDTTERK